MCILEKLADRNYRLQVEVFNRQRRVKDLESSLPHMPPVASDSTAVVADQRQDIASVQALVTQLSSEFHTYIAFKCCSHTNCFGEAGFQKNPIEFFDTCWIIVSY